MVVQVRVQVQVLVQVQVQVQVQLAVQEAYDDTFGVVDPGLSVLLLCSSPCGRPET